MTEQVQNFAGSGQPAPAESGITQPAAQTPQEKMIPQSEVNKIVGKIKDESYQKGMSDAQSRYQQSNAAPTYEQQSHAQPVMQQHAQPIQQVGGMVQQTPEQIRAMIAEEQQKAEYLRNYQGLVGSFISKVDAGKQKYEDFDAVAKELQLPQIPVIWQTAEKFDNPADIVYHLGKNPGKLAQLLTVAYSPDLVRRGMQEISDSLKQNESASEEKQPNAPLSRQKPSNIGMGNGDKSDKLSVQDWRKLLRT